MRKKMQDLLQALDAHPNTIRDALMASRTDEEMVDVIGRVKAVERKYRPIISQAVAETPIDADTNPVIVGEVHRAEVTRAASRTYNTPRLMSKLQAEGVTIMDLLEAGVIKLQWRWQELDRYCTRRGIELERVPHEVPEMGNADGDIGEVWGNSSVRWS